MKYTNTEEIGKSVNLIDWNEIIKHNTFNDLWIVINHTVYDITSFIQYHPGGHDILIYNAGKDVTDIFFDIHNKDILKNAEKFIIGKVLP